MANYVDEIVARLVKCGMIKPTAERICRKYINDDDYEGLNTFVRINEAFLDDRKEYVMEDR